MQVIIALGAGLQARVLIRLRLVRRDPSEGTAQELQGLEGGQPSGAHVTPAAAGDPARGETAWLGPRFSRRAIDVPRSARFGGLSVRAGLSALGQRQDRSDV